jgi:hypothetical protein
MNRWVLGIVCMGAMLFAISMDMRDEDLKFARECAYGSLGYLTVYVGPNKYAYEVSEPHKGREHAAAIIATGYRHTPRGSMDLTWFPPHKIEKVVVAGGAGGTQYQDVPAAT